MGTSNDYLNYFNKLKESGYFNWSEQRRARRHQERLSPEDLTQVQTGYGIQYVADCTKTKFLLPISYLRTDHLEDINLLIINYLIRFKITGKTPQDVIYKGMLSSDSGPNCNNINVVLMPDNNFYYVTSDFITDKEGNLIFGIFGECSKNTEGKIHLERYIIKMSPSVYINSSSDINKVILKYILPNIFADCEDCHYPIITPAIIKTVMVVKDTEGTLSGVIRPSISTFSNESMREMLNRNSNLFL